jgi:hypothetical protein
MEQPLNYLWVHREKRKYYRAYLSLDLFGTVHLQCAWGALDSARGNVRAEMFPAWGEAVVRVRQISKRRHQHGYSLVHG